VKLRRITIYYYACEVGEKTLLAGLTLGKATVWSNPICSWNMRANETVEVMPNMSRINGRTTGIRMILARKSMSMCMKFTPFLGPKIPFNFTQMRTSK